jgi:hypothetical protein
MIDDDQIEAVGKPGVGAELHPGGRYDVVPSSLKGIGDVSAGTNVFPNQKKLMIHPCTQRGHRRRVLENGCYIF